MLSRVRSLGDRRFRERRRRRALAGGLFGWIAQQDAVPLRFESLETRCLLSNGQWLVRLDGLAGETRDEQVQAATDLLQAAQIDSASIQVIDSIGVPGVVVIQT